MKTLRTTNPTNIGVHIYFSWFDMLVIAGAILGNAYIVAKVAQQLKRS